MTDTYVGRNRNGEKVFVSCRLRKLSGEHETTEHATVTDPIELAVMGVVIRKGGQYAHGGDWISAGQIDTDNLRRMTEIASDSDFARADLLRLADVWDEWHLNTLTAGCAHQTVVWENEPYRRPSLELTQPCSVTGYKYGHAWLVAPLPADVLEWARAHGFEEEV